MSVPSRPPLLEVKGLRASYRGRGGPLGNGKSAILALEDVKFCVERGQVLGLAGESGSGKSTLARLLCQLKTPDGGDILLDGKPLGTMRKAEKHEYRRRVQMVFQDPSTTLSPRRSIRQTLLEPLSHFGIGSPPERERMAIEALESVDLEASAMHRLPHQFSSGQRQRISIARALLPRPDLLIADEAVSSLDVSVQARILGLLNRLRQERDIAILFISHDLAVIRQLADNIGVMLQGRLVEYASADALFSHPAHPYTRQLLAAVPDPDPDPGSEPGPGPHLANNKTAPGLAAIAAHREESAGCRFADRCPDAMRECHRIRPALRSRPGSAAHVVECHLDPPE